MYRKKGLVIDSLVATSDPGRWLHRPPHPPQGAWSRLPP